MTKGSRNLVQFAGLVESWHKNRIDFASECNMVDYPLLGVIQMEDADWIVLPKTVQLIVVPHGPNIGSIMARWIRIPCDHRSGHHPSRSSFTAFRDVLLLSS